MSTSTTFPKRTPERAGSAFLLAGQGSNLQPPDSKSGVLPVELPAIECSAITLPVFRRPRLALLCSVGPTSLPVRPGRQGMQESGPKWWGGLYQRLASETSWDRSLKSAGSVCGRRSTASSLSAPAFSAGTRSSPAPSVPHRLPPSAWLSGRNRLSVLVRAAGPAL